MTLWVYCHLKAIVLKSMQIINPVDGHFCLHFYDTTAINQYCQAQLRNALAQA